MYRILFLLLISIGFVFCQEDELGRIAVSRIEGPNIFYSRNFSNKLEKELSNAGFTVVERREVKKLMEEWKFQSSGLTDDDPVEFEGISNADYLIVGTFTGIYEETGIFCTIKMIDISNGEIITTASIDGQLTEKNELYTIGIESLIEQIMDGTNTKLESFVQEKDELEKIRQAELKEELKANQLNEEESQIRLITHQNQEKRKNIVTRASLSCVNTGFKLVVVMFEIIGSILRLAIESEKEDNEKKLNYITRNIYNIYDIPKV